MRGWVWSVGLGVGVGVGVAGGRNEGVARLEWLTCCHLNMMTFGTSDSDEIL